MMKKILIYALYAVFWFTNIFVLPQITDASWGFFNQKTDVLPSVPKTPDGGEYTDLSNETAEGWGVNTLLAAIKSAINWALWLLALIALIILIIAWFKMLFNSGDDAKIKEGYKTVKNVAIALLFIGISWLLISFIFWAIAQFTWSE